MASLALFSRTARTSAISRTAAARTGSHHGFATSTSRWATSKQPKTLPEFSLEGKVRARYQNQMPAIILRILGGQVCLVTGGARGLGNEFCRAFVNSCVLWLSFADERLMDVICRGCTQLAVLDLKQSEAEDAAAELVSTACGMGNVTYHRTLKPCY